MPEEDLTIIEVIVEEVELSPVAKGILTVATAAGGAAGGILGKSAAKKIFEISHEYHSDLKAYSADLALEAFEEPVDSID